MVKTFSGNSRSSKHSKFLSTFNLYKDSYKPDIVCILEPRISGNDASSVIKSLGYDTWAIYDAIGFSGGIWVLWNPSDLKLEEFDNHKQFINLKCSSANVETFQIIAVYASPNNMIEWSCGML
ncbi:unnamed protein product [Linum trigynum]|uniref:Uncharacterized protein n=1 Tax=Linum trigynum TaxID=586398 RepID=A0AAV2DVX5_9ROSI